MKAFVTGSTGFVGSHVAKQLATRGADLRLLVRKTSNLANIASLKAEHVTGDLTDSSSLKRAMQGCEFVFHVAADYRLWTPDREGKDMYSANVEGTRAIIAAAQAAGVRRVIYCSSVATMGFEHADQGSNARSVTESDPVALAEMIGHYKRSK